MVARLTMGAPWFKRDPRLFESTIAEVTGVYGDLRHTVERDAVRFVGSIPVKNGEVEIDRFQVEISIPATFPFDIPIARETANRIPHTNDWHNPDGGLCVIVPEEWLIDPRSTSVLEFIRGPLTHFFVGHLLAEAGQGRPLGERPHGLPGLLQTYGEWIGTEDRLTICRYLEFLSHEQIKGHWLCPCGSDKRLRYCHEESVRRLQQRVAPRIARKALGRLRSFSSMQKHVEGLNRRRA